MANVSPMQYPMPFEKHVIPLASIIVFFFSRSLIYCQIAVLDVLHGAADGVRIFKKYCEQTWILTIYKLCKVGVGGVKTQILQFYQVLT